MSYVEKNLMPGELIVHWGKLHWAVFLPPAFVAVVSIAICSRGEEAVLFGGLLFLFLFLPLLGDAISKKLTSEFAVTNRRVMMKSGFVSRKTLEMLLTKIEAVSVDQSVLGRVLDFGTIVVGGTGGSKALLPRICQPELFRVAINGQIEKCTNAPFQQAVPPTTTPK